MTVNRVDGIMTKPPVMDIEEQSHHNPSQAQPLIWMKDPKASPDQLQRNMADAGQRSRTDLSGARLRDQLAVASSTTAAADTGPLTNGRFAGEPSLESVLQGGMLPKKSECSRRSRISATTRLFMA